MSTSGGALGDTALLSDWSAGHALGDSALLEDWSAGHALGDIALLEDWSAGQAVSRVFDLNTNTNNEQPYFAANELPKGAQTLARALEVDPTSARGYKELARFFFDGKGFEDHTTADRPNPTVRVGVLASAAQLSPRDTELSLQLVTALTKEIEFLLRYGSVENGTRQNAHQIRALRTRALDEARRLSKAPDFAYSPSVHYVLGQLHFALNPHGEAAVLAFARALMLQIGPWLGIRTDASPFSAELGRYIRVHLSHEGLPLVQRMLGAAEQRAELLRVLHGLDSALTHPLGLSGAGRRERQMRQALARQRRRRERVSTLGVWFGLWPHTMQRPNRVTSGRLLSCAIHRSSFYGPLVSELEARAPDIRNELLQLLRLRAAADPNEARQWYHNQEGIATRPEEWMQRHVPCRQNTLTDLDESTRQICAAVNAAMGWYYADANPDGSPSTLEDATSSPHTAWEDENKSLAAQYWGRAALSVLGPGQHVRAHTGPTNERVVISLGLAGALDKAELRVGDARRRWRFGSAIVFDDSFEHEVTVSNASGIPPRAVMIVHVLHPQLMPPGTNARALTSRMEAGEACEEGDHGFVDWTGTPSQRGTLLP